jgi:hypothetical protein
VDLRRGSLLLMLSCATGLLFGASYLGESPAQASSGGRSFEGQTQRMVETRQTLSETVIKRAKEVAYGLERAKDELEDLIP